MSHYIRLFLAVEDIISVNLELKEMHQKLWEVELEILDVIHTVCSENQLRYSLAYGTLLGAIRHNGFIPWDDDIDIIMPRNDYERLIEIWNQVAPEGFLLETENSSDDCVNNYAKIRKDHTTFLQFEVERRKEHHKGIFIDIFPGDRVAPNKVGRLIQKAEFAINLLFNRGYTSGNKGLIGLGEYLLLKIVPKRKYHKVSNFFGKQSRRWNLNSQCQIVFPSTINDCSIYYSPDLFDHLKEHTFCGKKYSIISDYDTALRAVYGDYMHLPPEEERVWTHHPIIIDFEHNYEELETEV